MEKWRLFLRRFYPYCRGKDDVALMALARKLSGLSARFVVKGSKVSHDIMHPSFWGLDGSFYKRITFKTNGVVSNSLTEGNGQEFPISGAPSTVNRLVKAQRLDVYSSVISTRDGRRGRGYETCISTKRGRCCL